ncbi:MAG TPA: SprT-like domain-containing protein, partial [Flavisolibacter sp.]|nr:SprT-like domain-containing protein [Flavisolibacter sp.]
SIHEISINPETLNEREPKAVISTLVHEMVHLWQQDHGKPSPGYHNKEWAAKMKEIGLQPSHTGEEGGRETGKNMTHYIVAGGPYEVAFNAMPEDFLYPFVCVPELSADEKKRKASKNKTKYTCPSCNENLWGKDSLLVQCAECEELFVRAA